MSDVDLKPCPFCGGALSIILIDNEQVDGCFFMVTRGNKKHKINCHCRLFMESELMPKNPSKWKKKSVINDLIESWNRRVNQHE